MMKKIKHLVLLLIISIATIGSFSFADKYFELSKNLDIFSTLFKELNTYYVDETEPGQLMKEAIDGMLISLDPYTNYIPEANIEDFRFMTTGQYGGIGALIHKEGDQIFISEPYEGFPADKAGLKAGDILLAIDGKSVEGKSTSEISEFLKGQPGTPLKVKIKHPSSEGFIEKDLELIRENIKINDVPYYGMLDEEIGYIKLNSFTQTASKEFIDAFKELKEKRGMQKLIFDLRGNGGGLLMEAVNIVNVFIPKGSVVVETRGKRKEWDATYTARNEALDTEMPLVVLVDEGSASASEIVAGTLQDYDRALIIGKQTFGKGLVQQTRPLSYNAQLKVTVAKYYIPSGRCIQRIDYSHKNASGVAEDVPDSLIKTFYTLKNKRAVKDGKGIRPDLITEKQRVSQLTASLVQRYYLFNFSTELLLEQNLSIEKAKDFELSDQQYNLFKEYLADKDISYTTKSERLLAELKKEAIKERYFEEAEEEYLALEKKLNRDKQNDLDKFKEEISDILENELVSRFHYQNGRIEHSLRNDDDVNASIDLLKDNLRLNNMLKGLSTSKN